MGLSLVTGPTVEPVTLAEAKAHLRVDGVDEDGLIAGYIFAARQYIESQVGPLITQTWDYTLDRAWPMQGTYYTIRLPYSPCQSVASISYVDENGATQTLDSSKYQSVLDAPVPYITKAYNQDWPVVRDIPAAITIRAVYGYAFGSVPDPIRVAILLMLGRLYEHREEVVAGVGITTAQVPMGIDALISPYALSQRSW